MFEPFLTYFQMPILPASILLSLVVAYWAFVILGAFDVQLLDIDVDVDGDVDGESVLGWGLVGLKWFNLGEVPLMVWVSAFALSAWLMSVAFDRGLTDPGWEQNLTACLRNFGVGLFAAKLLTQPLRGKLKAREPNTVSEMLGRTCTITTSEATPEYGQASCPSEGAPLLIQVRALEGSLARGESVEIVDYSPQDHIYFVRSARTAG